MRDYTPWLIENALWVHDLTESAIIADMLGDEDERERDQWERTIGKHPDEVLASDETLVQIYERPEVSSSDWTEGIQDHGIKQMFSIACDCKGLCKDESGSEPCLTKYVVTTLVPSFRHEFKPSAGYDGYSTNDPLSDALSYNERYLPIIQHIKRVCGLCNTFTPKNDVTCGECGRQDAIHIALDVLGGKVISA